ncbi:MAG: polyprenyl synthetase family protein [Oscillospiraceae bacterium]
MNSFQTKLNEYKNLVEKMLDTFVVFDENEKYKIITEAMRYSLLGGGKRIRAALVLAVYSEFSDDIMPAVPFACAIEMIHGYSLVHDDLPCMDDDDVRRGKPSCHKKFGEANALLAGDALLTFAFETITEKADFRKIDPVNAMKATNILASCAGYKGMIGGQVLDLASEGKKVSIEEIAYTNSLKTGKLIIAACLMGATIGGATEEYIAQIEKYASYIGIAFQIADDILDSVGDEIKLGKPIGSDLSNNKTTFVSEYGVEKAREIALDYVQKAKDCLKNAGVKDEFLYNMADMMVDRDS